MSRRDGLHFALCRTLEKDGWLITDDPLVLFLEQTLLKADIGAEKVFAAQKENQKIAVEIKDFDGTSVISELEKTIGQLQLYQWALEDQEPERQLFLAINQVVYLKHFQKPIFKLVTQRNQINLLVFEPNEEIIIQWIRHYTIQKLSKKHSMRQRAFNHVYKQFVYIPFAIWNLVSFL